MRLQVEKTVAILNLETTYGHEVSETVGKFLKENGFNVVYEEFFEPGNSDWTSTVQKVKRSEAGYPFCTPVL